VKEQVIKQFNKIAQSYDSERRSLIPCFDDFYNIIVELAEIKNPQIKILDIGAGTGLLTQFLLLKYPDAEYTLIDISDEMMAMAKKRFHGNNNIKYLIHDYVEYEFTEKFNLVVSSLSIHHLTDEEKEKLYKNIYSYLDDDGIFINGDQFLSQSARNEKLILDKWISKIESTILTEERKAGAYNRMKLDKTATVQRNLEWLEQAGFSDIDIFYKYYNFGIIYGRKKTAGFTK
jgi:tRNA (cmo5U34)-methyltransferase